MYGTTGVGDVKARDSSPPISRHVCVSMMYNCAYVYGHGTDPKVWRLASNEIQIPGAVKNQWKSPKTHQFASSSGFYGRLCHLQTWA